MAPRHAAKADRRRRVRLSILGCVVVLVAAAAVTFALLPSTINAPSAGAATHGPLQVRAITPTGTVVSPDAPLRVLFNNPLAAASPMPTIAPAVAGSWAHLSANELSFRANAPMTPGTSYVVTVPATTESADGTVLHTRGAAVASRSRWAPRCASTRCSQELGYLPLRFVPTGVFHPDLDGRAARHVRVALGERAAGAHVVVAAEHVHVITKGAHHAVRERPQPRRPTASPPPRSGTTCSAPSPRTSTTRRRTTTST